MNRYFLNKILNYQKIVAKKIYTRLNSTIKIRDKFYFFYKQISQFFIRWMAYIIKIDIINVSWIKI